MQPEFDFNGLPGRSVDGIAVWRKQREEQQLELARKLGLPIGQQVEVWLRDGVRLRGRLQFQEEKLIEADETLDLRFAVDGTAFTVEEMESCVLL